MDAIRATLNRIYRFFIRIFAFIRKELNENLRQTRLVLTVIVGPFLILLIFGLGFKERPEQPRTLIVVPAGGRMAEIVDQNRSAFDAYLDLQGVTEDVQSALSELRRRNVDLVIVMPTNPVSTILNNEQAVLDVYHFEIDPFEETYLQVLGGQLADEINRQILIGAAEQGKGEAASVQAYTQAAEESATAMREALEAGRSGDAQVQRQVLESRLNEIGLAAGGSLALLATVQSAGDNQATEARVQDILDTITRVQENLDALNSDGEAVPQESVDRVRTVEADLGRLDELLTDFREIDARVLVTPFRTQVANINQIELTSIEFFVPGVIALLLQHTAVTLAALSIVRERREGTMELMRAAPVSAFEALVGKYFSFLVLSALLALISTATVIYLLNTPMLGSWSQYALVLFLFLCASLGIGFHFSLSAKTDSQAVQFSMIILLASIFFSGFLMPLDRLIDSVQVVSWLIPATYATTMLQSIMLRGLLPQRLLYLALGGASVLLFILAWWRLRRAMISE